MNNEPKEPVTVYSAKDSEFWDNIVGQTMIKDGMDGPEFWAKYGRVCKDATGKLFVSLK